MTSYPETLPPLGTALATSLASFWESTRGPGAAETRSIFSDLDIQAARASGRREMVIATLKDLSDDMARKAISSLAAYIAAEGAFSEEDDWSSIRTDRFRNALHPYGTLTSSGQIAWREQATGKGDPSGATMANDQSPLVQHFNAAHSSATSASSQAQRSSPDQRKLEPERTTDQHGESSMKRLSEKTRKDISNTLRNVPLHARPIVGARRANKASLKVLDETDAQDVLNVILNTHFGHVVRDDPTHSVGGTHAKIDFLVPSLGVGVEVKVATKSHREGPIAREISADIEQYRAHHKIHTIFFIVYDLDAILQESVSLERDFTRYTPGLQETVAIVAPWHR